MQELRDKVEALVASYEEELNGFGIRIDVSKKYFEDDVEEWIMSSGNSLFNYASSRIRKKREKERGYGFVANRYHCFVLTVLPAEKGTVRRDMCREYAFVMSKVERSSLGDAPEKKEYSEERLLGNIEKKIKKILKKAEGSSAEKVCRDNLADALRYSACTRYSYKKKILGTDIYTWEIRFGIAAAVIAVIFALILAVFFG